MCVSSIGLAIVRVCVCVQQETKSIIIAWILCKCANGIHVVDVSNMGSEAYAQYSVTHKQRADHKFGAFFVGWLYSENISGSSDTWSILAK